jgi:hypothetical protein
MLCGVHSRLCDGEPATANAPDSAYIHVPQGEASDVGLDAATDERISSIVVSVDWEHRDIVDALHDIEVLCHRANPDKPRIEFRLDLGPNGTYENPTNPIRRDITYSFTKFSIRRLLGDLAMFTQTGFAIQRNKIVFVPYPRSSPVTQSKLHLRFPTLFIGPRADMEE